MASSQLISPPMKPYSVITWLTSLFLLIPLLPTLIGSNHVVMVAGRCREDQQSLLLQLKHGLTYPSFSRVRSWNESIDCCEWPGISCDLGGLGRVVGLDLSEEGITGGGGLDNSTALFSLTYLEELALSYNEFNTSIPAALANLTNLRYLELYYAGFYGQIPAAISQLTNLISLDLSYQNLQLENPNLAQLVHNLTHLTHLRLDSVDLSSQGNDWPHILSSSLPNLTVLSLACCSLSAPVVDSSLSKLQSLTELDLTYNNFSSPIPDFFLDSKNLTTLTMRDCGLIGTFPKTIVQSLTRLEYLDFYGNQLVGNIPPHWESLHNLVEINLRGNSLNGSIPPSLFSIPSLEVIDLRDNQLQGQIPEFSSDTSLTLSFIDLSYNSLNGTIPPSLSSVPSLKHIDLSHNQLEGCIPSSILELQSLQELDLSSNILRGNVKLSWFQILQNLWYLDLSYNNLTMDASINKSSTSPIFPQLYRLFLQSCNLRTFPELGNLSTLSVLDLSNNNINGMVPRWVMESTSLRKLNLSHNHLVSFEVQHFSYPIGNLSNLESLDLSHNKLIGHIPMELADLTFLSFLNLSDNHLVGSIPTGRQLQTFENNSYEGNPDLCGKPLTRSCTSPPPPPDVIISSGKSSRGTDWDFLSKAFGYVFGLAAVMLPAALWPGFRVWYWPKIDSVILWMFPKLYVKDWNNRLRRTRRRRGQPSRQ